MKKFNYTLDNKHYHTLDYAYKKKYNSKVFKVSLNAGFTCPNIDGSKGYGGCIYCSNGSGDFAGEKNDDLITQFNKMKEIMIRKWPASKYIGYFQANTNTYASVEELKAKYEVILSLDNVIGLNIATRPDSITDECLKYLKNLNTRTNLTIELGLQTIHDKTAKLINRCHNLKCFEEMLEKLRKENIDVVVHIINGLPYETKEDMIDTVKYLGKKDIQGIKIHMLHIMKKTSLEKLYQKEKFHVLSMEEYVDVVSTQLRYLNPEIIVNRIKGDPKEEDLVEPSWLIKKFSVLNEIDKKMSKDDIYQGDLYC